MASKFGVNWDYPTRPFRGRVSGFIGSPPCPAFSAAGKGEGREHVDALVAAIHARDWSARPSPDPRVWLSLDVGRWVSELRPEWVALEQVPAVLPLWRAFAHILEADGYSTWCGVLNSADYGVPQTRQRAILMASRTRRVAPPVPTHAKDPEPALFDQLERWVTMAEALGWADGGRVGFPRVDDLGTSPDGYRERDWRSLDEPAFAVTEKARSWVVRPGPGRWELNTGRDWKAGGDRDDAQTIDPHAQPAPAFTVKSGGQWVLDVESEPGAAAERYGDLAGTEAIRLTPRDALLLQSFPADYPVQGSKTKQFEQIGNAIPPRFARAILRQVIG